MTEPDGYASGGQWAVTCPKCGARRNRTCRTLATKRATNTHVARIDAWLARPWSAPSAKIVGGAS